MLGEVLGASLGFTDGFNEGATDGTILRLGIVDGAAASHNPQ